MPLNPPPGHADEKAMLVAWLDLLRDGMVFKIDGLSEEQARFKPTPRANSLLNLIVHLTGVERNWFERTIGGLVVERDRDAEFGDLPGTTTADAVAAYRDQCRRSNDVLDGFAGAEEACRGESGYSVRWVLHHMVEETSRHLGHADITRELIDGSVGWSRSQRD